MLVDAWLKMVGSLTPEDVRLLKARGCASELFALLEAFDKLAQAWLRTERSVTKADWHDIEVRLDELHNALREG